MVVGVDDCYVASDGFDVADDADVFVVVHDPHHRVSGSCCVRKKKMFVFVSNR